MSITTRVIHRLSGRDAAVTDSLPVTILRPSGKRVVFSLIDLWRCRTLLYFLAWRDIKVRYKQTILGAAWAIAQPLLSMLIFSFVFGRLAHVPSNGVPYPLFAYAGLLPWTFFSTAISNSGNSIVGNSNLITKVYFPRMTIPVAAVGAALVDFGIGLIMLFILRSYYGIANTRSILAFPAILTILIVFAIGVGLCVSALNVRYRDVRYALPFAIQLWMFVSPVIYPLSFLPGRFRWIFILNPLTGILEGFRAALLGLSGFDWEAGGLAVVLSFLVFLGGVYVFRRAEKTFADVI